MAETGESATRTATVTTHTRPEAEPMRFDKQTVSSIYRRTCGYCHLCHAKLSLKNYGQPGKRGAWQVEHSVPRSKGGTDHLNNLFAACIGCNLDKSNRTTRTARGWNGKLRAPLNPSRRK